MDFEEIGINWIIIGSFGNYKITKKNWLFDGWTCRGQRIWRKYQNEPEDDATKQVINWTTRKVISADKKGRMSRKIQQKDVQASNIDQLWLYQYFLLNGLYSNAVMSQRSTVCPTVVSICI